MLLFSAVADAWVGQPGVAIIEAFWFSYAFVAVTVVFYVYDSPVVHFFSGSVRLHKLVRARLAE